MSVETPEVPTSKQPEVCVCACGSEFEAYKRGATVIKKICPDCLAKKSAHPRSPSKDELRKADAGEMSPSPGVGEQRKPEAALDNPRSGAPAEIVILFNGHDEQMFQCIERLARRDRRTKDAQVLHWLETYVPELKAEFAER